MAAFLLVLLALVMVGANESVGYYYTHCRDVELFDCLMGQVEEEAEEENTVTATGVYEHKGYPVAISMTFPLAGGSVSGVVSDTCDGKVSGNFSGGAISGSMAGVCSPFFVNIPSSATYSGTVNKSAKTVSITFNGTGGGFSHQGSMTLAW